MSELENSDAIKDLFGNEQAANKIAKTISRAGLDLGVSALKPLYIGHGSRIRREAAIMDEKTAAVCIPFEANFDAWRANWASVASVVQSR